MRSCTARSRAIAVKRPSAPPPRRQEQRAIGRGDLADIVARDVGDDEDARLRRIVERRGMRAAAGLAGRWRRPVAASAPRQARLGIALPSVKVAEVTTTPCAGFATMLGERDAGIDPVAVHRDIGLVAVEAVERQPFDDLGPRRLGEIAQQRPRRRAAIGAPLEAAHRRVEPLAQARLGRFSGSSSRVRKQRGEPHRAPRPGGRAPAASGAAELDEPLDRRPRLGLEAVAGIGRAARASTCCRTSARKPSNPGSPRAFGDALRASLAGQHARGDQHLDQRPLPSSSPSTVADAALQAAGARAARASAPRSQRRSSRPSRPDSRTEKALSAASSR